MPVKAFQRYIKDMVNNKTYQLTVRPHLGEWFAVVRGDDFHWDQANRKDGSGEGMSY